MAFPSFFSCFLSLLSFLLFIFAASAAGGTITIPLSPFQNQKHASSDPYQILNNLAASSMFRARHLKHPKRHGNTTAPSSLVKAPLFPHSYGGYTISLNFGTPPQTLPFILDTGSSLVWFPCTSRYLCSKCAFPNVDPSKIQTFHPKLSSSSKLLGCKNPKCTWLFGPNVQSRCRDCDPSAKNCTQTCPPYVIQYGLGSTGGLLLLEALEFPHKMVPGFLVGCSIFSNRQPAGIAGFGRSPESLPSQMGLKKFSYCLVSRRFDDTSVSSNLILDTGSSPSDAKTPGLSYTPLLKNPGSSGSAFRDYYYVGLRKITVGNEVVKVPYKFLVAESDGNGGTIVDSGSTFTFMGKPVYELVAREFEKQMKNYSRAKEVENRAGLQPCFSISGHKSVPIPELVFHFKGGAKMKLPVENYFAFIGKRNVLCLMIVTDNVVGPEVSGGPAIILGNFQQQDYLVEFDLANNRFGFGRKKCV